MANKKTGSILGKMRGHYLPDRHAIGGAASKVGKPMPVTVKKRPYTKRKP